MPFTVENKEHSVVKFVLTDPLVLDDLKRILGLITNILETKKPFSFYVNCAVKIIPTPTQIHAFTTYLIAWMKASEPKIKESLQSSAIIITSSTFSSIFNGIFKIKPTIKPNLITTDLRKAEKFVNEIMIKYFENN